MNTQTLNRPVMLCSFLVASLPADAPTAQPLQACSRDYGFDIDEETLASELLAPSPVHQPKQAICGIDEDESAVAYLWFLS